MPADTTTFYLAFTAVFAGIGLYLLRVDRGLQQIEQRLEDLEGSRREEA